MEIWDVELGYVTRRRGARLHLVVGGRPRCGSGSGHIIESRKARASDGPQVCKKCREALRTRLVDVIDLRDRHGWAGRGMHNSPGNRAIVEACRDLVDGIMSPKEKAERDAMFLDIAERLHATHIELTTPKPLPVVVVEDELTLF